MRRLLGTVVLLGVLAAAPAAPANPLIHAHRGGPVVRGVPTHPEESLKAFRAAATQGFVLEADVKLTEDRVPVVIHDATLDRTTTCTGLVRDRTLAELRKDCRIDFVGSGANGHLDPTPTERIPTLADLLTLVSQSGVTLNVEIKNVPTDADFDRSRGFADTVVDTLQAAEMPSAQLIVQSFWPLNLDVVEERLPAVETSLLTLAQMNDGAPAAARARGYEWVSPSWDSPTAATTVTTAHAAGLRIVPYTINSAAGMAAAVTAGVDALITDDPVLARDVVAATIPPRPAVPAPPTATECAALASRRTLPTVEALDRPVPGAPRVFAMQYRQDPGYVETYATFRAKIECMVREHVVPRLASGRPNVIAFNEDVGLATIATGTRGKAARDLFARPGSPSCEPQGAPCGTLAGLAAVRAGYSGPLAAYRARFEDSSPVADSFLAATDTFGRGWMQVFSDVARRYGVYILGSNNQAPFRESLDPAEIALFADPDLPRPRSVFVATRPEVYNEVFLWTPEDARREGPWPLRNVVASNKKVPLTPIEQQLQISPGAATGPDAIANLRPFRIPGTGMRIGFATSLPAFVYGPGTAEPCADVSKTYMRCLDALGTTVVMQDEANPGRWANDPGNWQPLEWMSSTWRAVADPSVGFAYNVTPHMVGNLADLAFDGQTAITQRGGTAGPGCHYVGNAAWLTGDPEDHRRYAGPKTEFLGLLPWVTADAPRAELAATGARLAPGSGDPLEANYLEGAIAADLPFPPDPAREGCRGTR